MNFTESTIIALMALNASIMVGVLVFSSVLELTQDSEKFSVDNIKTRRIIKIILWMVQTEIVCSGFGSMVSLASLKYSSLYCTSFIVSICSVLLFVLISSITVIGLWLRR